MALRFLLTFASLLLLTACLSEESNPERPPERVSSTISGIVFDAAVSNSVVRVFEFADGKIGKQLGSTVTNPSGEYHIEVFSGSMPVYIEARGGLYIDPYTNNQVSENQRGPIKLAAYLNLRESSDHTVMITPLSNAAAGHIEYELNQWGTSNVASTINTSHNLFSQSFGLDIIQTKPLDLKTEGVSAITTTEHLYGALLMAYSSYSFEHIETDNRRRDISGYTGGQTVYTSYNLADIQYRDLASTGVMDGWELVGDSQVTQPLTFGLQIVDGELYTYELARHILKVAHDPNINRTGTNPSDYADIAQHLSESSEGLFPSRTPKPLNTEPPQAKRIGDDILVDFDQLTVNLEDFYGIAEVSAEIWIQEENSDWEFLWTCTGLNIDSSFNSRFSPKSEVCHQTNTDLEYGTRDIDLVFDIDTLALDSDNRDVSRVKLVMHATDLLGLSTQETAPHDIEFLWDNDAIIVVLDEDISPHRYNPEAGDYRLRGNITRGLSDLDFTGFQVGLDPNAHITSFSCIFPEPDDRVCQFDETIDASAFVSDYSPVVIHVHSREDEIRHIHEIYKDTLEPELSAYFPASDMKFIKHDAPREHLERYTVDKFNDIDSELYLKIDRVISTAGIKGYLPNFDFRDASQSLLDQHHIPSIKFEIGDFGEHPTSAENLRFEVRWVAQSQITNTEYSSTVVSIASDYEDNEEHPVIPFESYRKVGGFLSQMTYVVPFSSDIFGHDLIHVDKNFIQTLTVTVSDEAGNSESFETRFRSTMNDPHLNVYTPFEDALVTLYRFTDHGNHYPIGTCVTERVQDPIIETESQQDLSGCTVTSIVQNQPVRIVVDDSAERSKYQWREPAPMDTLLGATMAFSDIFFLPYDIQEKDVFITEVSVYKSGFFDFMWENDSDRSHATINQHIAAADALFDEPDGFFHFVPTQIRYATNIDLDGVVTPEFHYQHRFLAESMLVMARDEFLGEVNSVELAKAFYEDFKTGTLDGKDSQGNQIKVGSKNLKQHHYRYSLAEAYLEVVREFASDDDGADFTWADAMKFANYHIAFMEPQLNGRPLFDEGTASSPDKFPPSIEITLSALDEYSNVINVNREHYVKGAINVLTHVYDPSGIDGDPVFERCIKPTWSLLSLFLDCESYRPDGNDIQASGDNQFHRKFYDFNIDSTDLDGEGRVFQEFNMDVFASDNLGNDWYPDGNQSRFFIDNDAPIYDYHPPYVSPTVDLETTYFNLNEALLFTFSVADFVGEDGTLRLVTLFDKDNSISQQFSYEELINGNLKLCAEANESCGSDDNVHAIEDGKWSLRIDGSDLLGNDTVEQEAEYIFPLMIDSSAPIITEDEIGKGIVGSDYRWEVGTTVDYGPEFRSEPGELKVSIIHPGTVDPVALSHCDDEQPGNDCKTHHAYLVGERHETSVVIVSDNLENEGEYKFVVSAFDTAVPSPNEGIEELTVEIDNQGPIIHLADEPIDNSPNTSKVDNIMTMDSPTEVIVGTRFSVLIDSIEDRSDVQTLQVLQLGQEQEFLLIDKEAETTGKQSIQLLKEHTDNIEGSNVPGASDISLIVRGFDEWGNTQDTSEINVRFVNSEPVSSISEYDSVTPGYYTSNYRFDVEASNDREQITLENIRFYRADIDDGDWLPLVDEQIPVLETESFVLSVQAEDSVGNVGVTKFEINVDNASPDLSTLDINEEMVSEGENTIDWELIGGRDNDGIPVMLRYNVPEQDVGRIEMVSGAIDESDTLHFTKYEEEPGKESWLTDITSLTVGPDDAYGSYTLSIESIKDTFTDGTEETHINRRSFDVTVDLDRSAPTVSFRQPAFENVPEFEIGTPSLFDGGLVAVGPIFNILINEIEDDSKVTEVVIKQQVNGEEGPTLKVISNQEGISDLDLIELSKEHTRNIVTDHGDDIELYLYLEDEHGNGDDSQVLSVEYVWQTPQIRFDADLENYYSSNYEFEVTATSGEEDVQAIEVNRAQAGWVLVEGNRFTAGEDIDEDFSLSLRATNRVGQRTESEPVQVKIDNLPPGFELSVNDESVTERLNIDWDFFDDYGDTRVELKVAITEQDQHRIRMTSGTCEGERCPDELEFTPGGQDGNEYYTAEITSITLGDGISEDGRGSYVFDLSVEKDTQVAEGETVHIANQQLTITVDLDRTAPIVKFQEDAVINRPDNVRHLSGTFENGTVVGEAFDIMIEQIVDDSRVVKLEVFEVTMGMRESIKLIEAGSPDGDLSGTNVISILAEDAVKLSGAGSLQLLIHAVDEHGNSGDSGTIGITFDNSEPTIELKGFDSSAFYSSLYVFDIETSSGSLGPKPSVYYKRNEGDDWTEIEGSDPTIEVDTQESYTLWLKAVNQVEKEVINSFDIQVDNSNPEVSLFINDEAVKSGEDFLIDWGNHDDDEPTIFKVDVTSEGDAQRVDYVAYCLNNDCGQRIELEQSQDENVWTVDISEITKGDGDNLDGQGSYDFDVLVTKPIHAHSSEEGLGSTNEEFTVNVDIDRTAPIVEFQEEAVINRPDNVRLTPSTFESGTVVGEAFDIMIEQIVDDSRVVKLEVFEVTMGMRESIKLIEAGSPDGDLSGTNVISILAEDAAKLSGAGSLQLLIHAVDEHENSGDSGTIGITFDNSEPTIELKGFDSSAFYSSLYVFDIETSSGSLGPKPSVYYKRNEGDDWTEIEGSDPTIEVETQESYTLWLKAVNQVEKEVINSFDIQVDNSNPEVSLFINDEAITSGEDFLIDWSNHDDDEPTIFKVDVTSEGDAQRVDYVAYCLNNDCGQRIELEQSQDENIWTVDISEITLGDGDNLDGRGSYDFDVLVTKPIHAHSSEEGLGSTNEEFTVNVDLDRTAPRVEFQEEAVINRPDNVEHLPSTFDTVTVVGEAFDIMIEQIVDDSRVVKLEVFEVTMGIRESIKLIEVGSPDEDLSGTRVISILPEDSDKLSRPGPLLLLVHAVDEHDNSADSDTLRINYDNSEPTIELKDFDSSAFYSSLYVFDIEASSGILGPQPSVYFKRNEGDDWTEIEGSDPTIEVETQESYTLWLKAVNQVEKEVINSFDIQVDNSNPEVSLFINDEAITSGEDFLIDWSNHDDDEPTIFKVDVTSEGDAQRVDYVAYCLNNDCGQRIELEQSQDENVWTVDISEITLGDGDNLDGRGSYDFDVLVTKPIHAHSSEEGLGSTNEEFTVNVDLDRTAPIVEFQEEAVINRPDNVEHLPSTFDTVTVVGEAFDIMIEQIVDGSRVVKLEVFEVTMGIRESIKLIEAGSSDDDLSGTRIISILPEDSDKLSRPGPLQLLVHAVDEHDNSADSDTLRINYDNSEPTIELKDFDSSAFYSSLYVFDIEASSGILGPQPSVYFKRNEGDDWTEIEGSDPTIEVETQESYTLWLKAVNQVEKEVINSFDIKVDNSNPEVSLFINDEAITSGEDFLIDWSNHDDDEPTIFKVDVTSEGDAQRVDYVAYCLNNDCDQRVELEQSQEENIWTADISEITLGDGDNPDGQGTYDFDVLVTKPIHAHSSEEGLGSTNEEFTVNVDLDRTAPEIELDTPPVTNIKVGTPELYNGDNTVGRVFDINFVTLEDEKSDITQMIVYQRETGNVIKQIDELIDDGTAAIRLLEQDTANIEVVSGSQATLYVVAVDEHGNNAQSDDFGIVYVESKPIIELIDYNEDSHFTSNYTFTVNAINGSEGAVIEDLEVRIGDGANNEFEPIVDSMFQVNRVTGSYQVYIRATNEVEASTIEQFTINIDDEDPLVTVLMNEDSLAMSGERYKYVIDNSNMGAYRLTIDIGEPDNGRIQSVSGTFDGETLDFTQSLDSQESWYVDLPDFVEETQNGNYDTQVSIVKDTVINEFDSPIATQVELDIEVNIDLTAPIISDLSLTNVSPDNDLPEVVSPATLSNEPIVIGSTFTMGIANIESRSKLTDLIVSVDGDVLKQISSQQGIESERILLHFGYEHSAILGEENRQVTLLVEAVDEWGNTGESTVEAYFYGSAPKIDLPDYDVEQVYPKEHTFEVVTADNTDVTFYRTDSHQAWLEVESEEVSIISNDDYTLQIRAENRAGLRSEQHFYVQIEEATVN